MTRRLLSLLALAGCMLALGACSLFQPADGSGDDTTSGVDADATGDRSLTVGGAGFTEQLIMQQLYGQLLTRAGFTVTYKATAGRDAYLPLLETGQIDVVPEYLATMTEFLNHQANGDDATVVASGDPARTLDAIRPLARWKGLAVLEPSMAADQNGFAVRRSFGVKYKVTNLTQLAQRGGPQTLAATADCAQRPFCLPGLTRVYGVTVAKVLPLGFGTAQTKRAVLSGEATVGLVGTTDGTLPSLGLRLLRDDRRVQLADNLVPVVNRRSAGTDAVSAALDKLATVLTTRDLADLNEEVDGGRQSPATVAREYLTAAKLL